MGLARLTTIHIAIIGLVSALVIGVAFYFLGPHKTMQNLRALADRDTLAEAKLAEKPKNEAALKKAEQEVREVQAQYASYEQRLMPKPPIDLTNQSETALTKAMIVLWKQPYLICSAANKFARDQAKRYKVRLLSPPFSIAGQPTDPAAIPTTIIELPMGTLQVAGGFQNVNNYMRSWNRFKRLVAIDGLQLTSQPTPTGDTEVVGQANVTVYIYPRANPNQAAASTDASGYGGYGPSGPGYGGPPGAPGGGPPGYGSPSPGGTGAPGYGSGAPGGTGSGGA